MATNRNKGNGVHVVPHEKGWATKSNGITTGTYKTQRQAIEQGKKQAQKVKTELFTHDSKGRVRDRSSFGKDPFPPRG